MTELSQKPRNDDGRGLANRTKVVRGLLAELLQGKWHAAGRLTEAEACQRFKVSRTPVREALFELQGLGLLEIRRNCGAVMHAFGPKELAHIYAVRTLLEVEATRLAAAQAKQEEVSQLIEDFGDIADSDSKSVLHYWERESEVHHLIGKCSGNLTLAAEIDRYSNLVQMMMEIIEEKTRVRIKQAVGEHTAILEAVKSGKAAEAAEAMRKHLEQAFQKALAAMEAFRAASN